MARWHSIMLLAALCGRAYAFDFDDEEEDEAPGSAHPTFFTDEASGASAQLEHAMGGKAFQPRSKLFYHDSSSKSGVGPLKGSARVAQAKLSGDDLDAIQALAKAGGFYSLRLPSTLSDPDSPAIVASVSACALVASRFQEQLHLTMGGNGQVVALSYVVPVVPPDCSPAMLPRVVLDEVLFNTTVIVQFPQEGPRPHGKIHEAAFLPPAAAAAARAASSADGKEGADGQPPPPQSFLRKYWMYILPVVLLLTVGGGDPAPAEGGGEGGGGGGGSTAAAARAPARRRN